MAPPFRAHGCCFFFVSSIFLLLVPGQGRWVLSGLHFGNMERSSVLEKQEPESEMKVIKSGGEPCAVVVE